MDITFVYDIPNALFLALCVAGFAGFSVLGALVFRRTIEHRLGLTEAHNGLVETFLSVSGLFYGITLGLIAVGTYDTFKEADATLTAEAATLNAMYRNAGMLAQPQEREHMQAVVRAYTEYLAGAGWALQRKGIIATGTSSIVDTLEAQLTAYPIAGEKDAVVFGQVLELNTKLSELRRQRVAFVQAGLPAAIWHVVLLGALIITVLTWLLVIDNRRLDIAINLLCGGLLGSLIFIIAAMDHPFLGEFSVSPEPYQLLLDGVMKR